MKEKKIALIREYLNNFHAIYLINFGVELGLFNAFKEIGNKFTVKKLADYLKLHESFVDYWCQASYAINILEYKKDFTYSIDEEWMDILTNVESESLIKYLPNCHIKIAELYPRIHSSFKSGKIYNYDDNSNEFIEAVEKDGIRFTNNLIKNIIPKFPELEKRLNKGANFLDIGCGTANNLVLLAKHFSKTKYFGVDNSIKSINIAKKKIEKENLLPNISVYCQCASKFNQNTNIDIATFIESLHEINQNVRNDIFRNLYNVLNNDGIILIIDCIKPASIKELRKPEYKTSAIIQWFEMTWGTNIPGKIEINNLLNKNNFTMLEEIPISDVIVAGIARKKNNLNPCLNWRSRRNYKK